MSLFDADSPFQRFLYLVADLLVLNIVTALLCIPVITAGASLTAMHYVLLRMVRGEEGYVVKAFFHSFRQNFRQATLMGLVFLAAAFLMGGNLYLIIRAEGTRPVWLAAIVAAASYLLVMFACFAFPLLSRFTGTVWGTIGNAVVLSFVRLPRAAAMAFVTFLPAAVACAVRVLIPVVLLFGFSLPGYVCALLYSPVFRKLENEIRSREKKENEPDDGKSRQNR